MLITNDKNQIIGKKGSSPVLKIFPVVFLFLFLSIAGEVHVYLYNELLEDGGCAIGALFCHGESKEGDNPFFSNPLQFQFLIFLPLIFSFSFVLSEFSLQRGPPSY